MMSLMNLIGEAISAKKQIASLKNELASLRSYVDKMDGIAEQIVEWGNECAASNAHYKEMCLRLKEDLEKEHADKMMLVDAMAKMVRDERV